jgi:5,10-methylene-tetrahydrofolate dehydrogenase/methenyl tetrahydrofolate cyclohydrolase
MRGRSRGFVPATPIGVMELLQRSGLEVAGRSAVVLGDSNVVGTPLSCLLRDRGAAAVTVCHRVSLTEWFEDQEQVRISHASRYWFESWRPVCAAEH